MFVIIQRWDDNDEVCCVYVYTNKDEYTEQLETLQKDSSAHVEGIENVSVGLNIFHDGDLPNG